MADSLISVLAVRAGEIVSDLLAHREQAAAPDPAATTLMRA
jgi:lysine/ornithine N-monooxygenase